MAANNQQVSNGPQFPLLKFTSENRKKVISCMNPLEIVEYSFSSKAAALAVKDARIHVDLMEIYLYGVSPHYDEPDNDQGIELTFAGCEKSVLFWFAHPENLLHDDREQWHNKTTIDGEVLEKCFHESWRTRKVDFVTGCSIEPDQMVPYLKMIENHFREIFIIKKTDIDLNGLEITDYMEYLDVTNPKIFHKLRINSDYEPEHASVIVSALRPSYFFMDILCWSTRPSPLKIVADRVQFGRQLESAYLFAVKAKRITFRFKSAEEFKIFVQKWLTDKELLCRDELELLKAYVPLPVNRNDLLREFDPVAFDRSRRPASLKHQMNDDDDEEVELDLRHDVDLIRDDGRVATTHFENYTADGDRYMIIWFSAWPKTD